MTKIMTKAEPLHIHLTAEYLSIQSIPMIKRYAFLYCFTIHNHSDTSWTLSQQTWQATNTITNELVHQRHEEGIAGQTPLILPKHCFTAKVALMISEPKAILTGNLTMLDDQGNIFQLITQPLRLDFDVSATEAL